MPFWKRKAAVLLIDIVERQEGRWFLWLPVLLGVGIGVYFSLPEEPSVLASLLVLVCAVFVAASLLIWRKQLLQQDL